MARMRAVVDTAEEDFDEMPMLVQDDVRIGDVSEVEIHGEPKAQALDLLVSLIPAEAIAVYIAAIGIAAASDSELARWACLGVVFVLTPAWVAVSYLEQRSGDRIQLPLFEMVVGAVAFVAWTTAVPEGPWDDIGLPTWVGSLVVLLASACLYVVTRFFAAWSK